MQLKIFLFVTFIAHVVEAEAFGARGVSTTTKQSESSFSDLAEDLTSNAKLVTGQCFLQPFYDLTNN